MKWINLHLFMIVITGLWICVYPAYSEIFGGIDFPDGPASFADEVILYNPLYNGGPAPTMNLDTADALGIPEGEQINQCLSLGRGGLIELLFTNNVLVNSGNSTHDLHVFEIGPDVEDTYVAIRPTAQTALLLGSSHDTNGDGYYEIGRVFGSTSSIDIDSVFPGFQAGELVFDAVQLIDDYNEGGISGESVGADIDAVGAIGSVRLCKYYLIGDLNLDCTVDLQDLALMATNWLIDCTADPANPACIPLESN